MHKQVLVLLTCGLCMATIGSGIMPLLPLYALTLGATSGTVGVIMAAAYVALAIGTVTASRLAASTRSHKRALVAVGLVSAPMLGLLGQTGTIWQFAALFTGAWFCGGVAGALISIAVGLSAEAGQRGRVFGLLWLREPLGMLIGATTLGAAAELFGYGLAFALAGAVAVLWPLLGAVALRDAPTPAREREQTARPSTAEGRLPAAFLRLLAATVLATTPIFVGRLGTTFSMQAQGFSTGAISSTVLLGGVITLPLLPLLSLIADRLGRKPITLVAYGLAVAGTLLLAGAEQLWQFWVASALLTLASNTSGAMAAALGADLLSRAALARGLPLLSMATWVAAMAGSAITGYGLVYLGATGLYGAGAGLALGAMALIGLRDRAARATAHEGPPQVGTAHGPAHDPSA